MKGFSRSGRVWGLILLFSYALSYWTLEERRLRRGRRELLKEAEEEKK